MANAFKKPESVIEMERLVQQRVTLSGVGRWVDNVEYCNNQWFHDKKFLNRAILTFASADRARAASNEERAPFYAKYYKGNAALMRQNVQDAKEVLRATIKKVCAFKKVCMMSPRWP